MKKILSLLVTAICLIFIFNLSKELLRLSKVDERIGQAKQKKEELKLENWQLKQELAYRQTDEFIEEGIRDKLLMSKKGETMVIVPSGSINIASSSADIKNKKELDNWEKWLEVFRE